MHRGPQRPVLMVEVGGRGGVSDYTQALVEALDAAGRPVTLVTARDHLFDLPPSVTVLPWIVWVRDSARVGRILRRAGLGRLMNALAFVAVLPRIALTARRSSVVHLQGGYFPPLAALLALTVRATQTPFVHTAHSTFDRTGSWGWAHSVIKACARTTIVHTRADVRRLGAHENGRVRVIPHGEYGGLARRGGTADRAAARARLGVGEDEVVALLFGQLRADKGVGDFLTAVKEAPGLRALVGGQDIGGLAAAREALDALGPRVIVEEGFLPMPEVARLFAAADVVVLPYRIASQSGVLLLAYGFGRPVAAYPVDGLAEAVEDGETGWLTAGPTPAALAATLREVAAAGVGECARRGAAGQRLADEQYAWPVIARATLAVYDAA